jgi:hypothetical protein
MYGKGSRFFTRFLRTVAKFNDSYSVFQRLVGACLELMRAKLVATLTP